MSQDRHGPDDPGDAAGIVVRSFPMGRGARFGWHAHDKHQLVWGAAGVLTIGTDAATWVLPPTRALWVPAGISHEVRAGDAATMTAAYLRPAACAVTWAEPTTVRAGGLLRELTTYLAEDQLDSPRRRRAEEFLADVLEPVPAATIDLRLPGDERAAEVAAALLADPACRVTLAQWGRRVGASERTLARAFLAGAGVPFGRWRTLARLAAALPLLAAGKPVGNVARAVGYENPSAFVAAFRRETGATPGTYLDPPPGLDPRGRGRPGGND
ncbi:MAG TPA: helix-turn-helix transcriptional regulator [Streptosporangiaceae bacterium]|nr:helix-turn-helix transcriptional regulator [Streptosporangiaceae bacterium]